MAQQNILLLIRADIKALDDKVTSLQGQVDDVRTNLPDVTEINSKLDGQATTLDSISNSVNIINDILNPEIPDVPLQQNKHKKK
ncbi:p10 [Helicoverpa armigera multiple nucleopolyhedrovirus]|uniref:p10 n=2 Tax=Alphabaculovirus TaxID=558016 RepID=I3XMG6_NPVMB|nr:putative P10 [Mamestra configurata nucleopolyhedrovirus B]YP_009011213.1 p10 [Mamestra brassicae multiple nucleopolyhedrovirus]ACH88674.1 p10 [Helicoverpa armigera multiple nucleopolyhedrovirus]WNA17531.1 p10 [Alphabaculovirus mabrassicae]AAM95144.1 putative P10 [Mamestra configurata nucleopolyhedrovirus B]AFL64999.1 p10 [Mamestra brassicae multiple nucleopolyhedrovirus]AFP95872.2 p10 [Mamestra brassicae multiple nucleopolyhedrovirus]